jgi:Putative endonuclease segE, GIY-YIG domain/NUMOD3 motif
MYGHVYLTENLINGKTYIGKHRAKNTDDANYLGSGTAIKYAIKKYGAASFRRKIISIADSKEELNVLEIAVIAEHDAVQSRSYYMRAGGSDGAHPPCSVEHLENYAAKTRLRWQNMSPEQRAEIGDRIRKLHLGRPKTPEHRAKLSAAKKGVNNWTPEAIASMVAKRRAQIAMGIGVPPKGNRGNKDYRHNEINRQDIRIGVRKARERIFSERDSYLTEAGAIAKREKLALHYTEEVRQYHAKRIREGQARRLAEYKAKGIAPPKFHWYHNPADPTERASFANDDDVPDGWIAGMGRRKRKIDVARVVELIEIVT